MTELLTESFCERCGTRYELGTPEPMTRSRKTRGLVTGLRSFIMSTESLSDSIGDAMRAEEESLASRQIDAFQDTFNFCLDCRRYTCMKCWNDDEGRCRSCMPVPGVDDVGEFDDRMPAGPALMPSLVDEVPQLTMAEEPAWPAAEPLAPAAQAATPDTAWPAEDEIVVPAAAAGSAEWPEEPEVVLAEVEPEPVVAEEPEVVLAEVEPEPVVAEEEPEPVAAEIEEDLVVAAAVEVEEPVAEAPTIEPEPAAPEPLPIPTTPRRDLRDTFARGPLVPPRPASSAPPEQLAARRSQLDILGIEDPGEGTVSVGGREALPYRSSGAGSNAMLAAVWDASTRALEANAQRAALRPCDSCGLTVSSTARFCRRCGAPQTLSA